MKTGKTKAASGYYRNLARSIERLRRLSVQGARLVLEHRKPYSADREQKSVEKTGRTQSERSEERIGFLRGSTSVLRDDIVLTFRGIAIWTHPQFRKLESAWKVAKSAHERFERLAQGGKA